MSNRLPEDHSEPLDSMTDDELVTDIVTWINGNYFKNRSCSAGVYLTYKEVAETDLTKSLSFTIVPRRFTNIAYSKEITEKLLYYIDQRRNSATTNLTECNIHCSHTNEDYAF